MIAKEELVKLLMESYDQGVEDAKQAALVAIAQVVYAEREAIAKMLEDWDSDSADPRDIAAAIRARGQA